MSHNHGVHRTTSELEAMLPDILQSPEDSGPIEMIVRRPGEDRRETLESAELTPEEGLSGDDWRNRGTDRDAGTQLTLMNSRVAAAVAVERDRWPLAGDQIYVDMDLSHENLPAGTRLQMGEAVIEISEIPHNGCPKFAARFGTEALRFANVGPGRAGRFRGVYASVVEGGAVRVGDKITKF